MLEPKPDHGFLDFKDGALHYSDWGGQGPPVLLLHGLQDCTGNWGHIAKALSGKFHVYALDSRGHGCSTHTPGRYTFEEYVSEVGAAIDSLDLQDLILIGHSAGGKYAFSYASQEIHKVSKLVIVDMDPDQFNPGSSSMFERYREESDEWKDIQTVIDRLSLREPLTSQPLLKQQAIAMTREQDDGSLIWKRDRSVILEYERPDAWHLLPKINIPTLLMRGENSQLLTQSVAERMAQQIPECQLVIVPNSGHWCYGENPEDFIYLLLQFLNSP